MALCFCRPYASESQRSPQQSKYDTIDLCMDVMKTADGVAEESELLVIDL